jgi:ATP-dependent RNA helicase DDX24/MAK5
MNIDDLVSRLDFRDPEPVVIDLSPKDRIVSTFQESKVECLTTDKVSPSTKPLSVGSDRFHKDSYLYYFLLRYPGRSLVFMSSIDGIRRLTPILGLLQLTVWPLHSQMEQKQRLRNLDR